MMMRTLPHLALVVAVAVGATACAFERSTNVVNPTSPSTPSTNTGGTPGAPGNPGAPSSGVPPMVGTWVSNEVQLPSPTSCGHFQYQILTQTANSISGTFTAQCASLNISGNASGDLNGTTVNLHVTGNA